MVLGVQELFVLKDVKGPPARERARSLSEELKAIAENPDIPVDTLDVSDFDQPLTLASTGGRILFATLDVDARAEGMTRRDLANKRADIVRAAIEKYRCDYGRKQIILGIVYSLLATLLLLAVLYLLVRVYRAVVAGVDTGNKDKKLHMESPAFVRAERINTFLVMLAKIIRFIIPRSIAR